MPGRTEVAILRELMSPHSLQWDIRTSLADVAAKVGVSEDTVRRRLQKLYDVGFIRHWELVVNPSLLGLTGAVVEMTVGDPSEKEALLRRVKRVDRVRWIFSYYNDGLATILFYEDEASLTRTLDLIAPASGELEVSDWSVPPCRLRLSKTDWRLIWSLRHDPRKVYSAIAKELGVSTRTAVRRIGRMSKARAFFLNADLDVRRLRGVVPCDLRISCDDKVRKNEIRSFVLSEFENVVYTNEQAPDLYFVILCDTVAEVDDVEKQIRALAGVRRARARIQEEWVSVTRWMDHRLEQRLE